MDKLPYKFELCGGFFMQNILHFLKESSRHSNKSKADFIQVIREWAKTNLKSYNFSIEKNMFIVNFKELISILFLYLNCIFLYCIMQNLMSFKILDAFLFFTIYIIQFKLVFVILSILIPSKNIILSKNSKKTDLPEIIVCAHYDTKHSYFKVPNNILKQTLKRNIYGISRIFGSLVWKAQRLEVIFILVLYLIYLLNFPKIIESMGVIIEYFPFYFGLVIDLGVLIIVESLFCIIILLLFTIPFLPKTYNPGADDNTSGVLAVLKIAKILEKYPNINFKAILFDNEEKGMIGSTHFAIRNMKLLKTNNSKVINLDCIGRGETIYIVSDKFYKNDCMNTVIDCMDKNNVNFEFSDIDFSDHKPFMQFGIDSISISRCNKRKYLWNNNFPVIDWIHGNEDSFENINEKNIQEVVDVVVEAIKNS